MYKLEYADKDAIDKIESEFGGYNDFPPGWREIDGPQFAQRLCHRSPIYIDYRQIRDPEDRYAPFTNGQLMFFDDNTGIAIVSTYTQRRDSYSYIYGVKFYAFGCDHDYHRISADKYRELVGQPNRTVFRTEHPWQCSKCGDLYIVDSSD